MKATERKARWGMKTFVAIIFGLAVVIAAVYTIGFTPGEVAG